ncbi:hypothetical protein YQE_02321, partial [Dendroctonus ponderosae]
MNLSGLRAHSHSEGLKIETPLAVRLGAASQLPTSPLRVQVNPHPNRMMTASSPHTHLLNHHSGIMRIATQNLQSNGPVLHRPYSPPRLTFWFGADTLLSTETKASKNHDCSSFYENH